ncbi:MAG: class I SAM-dependent methyltransferase [Deltaproteobacteria bacterium]|nr:class I SAM-dependent methyltransferase [Deltaproteobacteria bacterium]MBW2070444.1 class I SAM-dependent methyltransferase [Deltaproteobacteria bacterium]
MPPQPPLGAGRSSFNLLDSDKLFTSLPLFERQEVLDIGCGRGEYALALAAIVGDRGRVHALDLWQEGIRSLREQAAARNLRNLDTYVADVGKRIPLADNSIDLCFMATVFHDLVTENVATAAISEITRVLKAEGWLAIVEFKKIEGGPGPPAAVRLAPEQVVEIISPFGFRQEQLVNVGPYNYLLTLRRTRLESSR